METNKPIDVAAIVEAVRDYNARGCSVHRLLDGKSPGYSWPDKEHEAEGFTEGDGIGIKLGDKSGGLVVVDLDCPEAVHAGKSLLPKTRTSGHGEETHYWYVFPLPKKLDYKDLDGSKIMEVLTNGQQVVAPPSRHPDGSRYAWVEDAEPTKPADLVRACNLTATAALLMRHFKPGGLHDLSYPLAGFLMRDVGLSGDECEKVFTVIWEHVHPEGLQDALNSIKTTTTKIDNGDKDVAGFGKLQGEMRDVGRKIAQWFGVKLGGAGDDLTRIGREMVEELFTDQFGQPYALIDGRSVPVSSLGSRLRVKYLDDTGKTAESEAIKNALNTLAAIAEVKGDKHELRTRWGHVGDAVWYETAPGRVYRIDASGWTLDQNPPVRFRHIPNLKPLPEPSEGGSIGDLERFIKLEGRNLRLYLSLLASAPFEDIPRPVLAMIGLKGRGKTTRSLFFKRLMDEDGTDFVRPNEDILRKATHRGIVACDNQSALPKGVSDLLCGLVTGTGDAARRLYSDNEEFGFKVKRSVILNGINLASEQPDLLERSLVIEAPEIKPSERITESEFWGKFERERGKLLGVVFDSISGILRHRVPLKKSPRMADWAELAAALYEYAGWGREQFATDWKEAERSQNEGALEGSVVGQAIVVYVEEHTRFGPASMKALLEALKEHNETLARDRGFPKKPNSLSREINKIVDALRAHGIEVTRPSLGKGKAARKGVALSKPADDAGEVYESADGSAGTANGLPMDSEVSTDRESPIGKPNTCPPKGGSADTADTSLQKKAEENPGVEEPHGEATGKPRKTSTVSADIDRPAYLSQPKRTGIGRLPADPESASADHDDFGECPPECAKCRREDMWNRITYRQVGLKAYKVWRSHHGDRTPKDLELANFRKARCQSCEGFTRRHARYSNMGDGVWIGGEYCSGCGHHETEICDEGIIRRMFYRTQLKVHGSATRVAAAQG